MRALARLLLRLVWWQMLLAAPLVAVRWALEAAGLTRAVPEADQLRMASIGDGFVLKSDSKSFRGGEIAWCFGGLVLDLRVATLADAGAELRIVTVMGGTVVTVPPDLVVELHERGFLGSTTPAPPRADASGPILRITSTTILGGLTVARRDAGAAPEPILATNAE